MDFKNIVQLTDGTYHINTYFSHLIRRKIAIFLTESRHFGITFRQPLSLAQQLFSTAQLKIKFPEMNSQISWIYRNFLKLKNSRVDKGQKTMGTCDF